jgi:FkbM family methyltransferase
MASENKKWLIFRFGNIIYNHSFLIYRILYFLYKRISDRKRIILLKDKIKRGMTVLDIGANIGFYTRLFSKLVGEHGRVYAFEPDELNFKYLQLNSRKLNNVNLIKSAVGEKSERIHLYLSDDLNVDHRTYDPGEDRTLREIQCICIDDFLKNRGNIDFIKIDIQGYDYYAILGMKDTIKRSGEVMILGELWPYGLNKAGIMTEDYLTILEDLGFTIRFFDNKEVRDFSSKVNEPTYDTDFFGLKRNI